MSAPFVADAPLSPNGGKTLFRIIQLLNCLFYLLSRQKSQLIFFVPSAFVPLSLFKGFNLSMSRGKGIVSRTYFKPQIHAATVRSIPKPKPECGTEPYSINQYTIEKAQFQEYAFLFCLTVFCSHPLAAHLLFFRRNPPVPIQYPLQIKKNGFRFDHQNSVRCRLFVNFSARNVGVHEYTFPNDIAQSSRYKCPFCVKYACLLKYSVS